MRAAFYMFGKLYHTICLQVFFFYISFTPSCLIAREQDYMNFAIKRVEEYVYSFNFPALETFAKQVAGVSKCKV